MAEVANNWTNYLRYERARLSNCASPLCIILASSSSACAFWTLKIFNCHQLNVSSFLSKSVVTPFLSFINNYFSVSFFFFKGTLKFITPGQLYVWNCTLGTTSVYSSYPFEPKVCRMVELCTQTIILCFFDFKRCLEGKWRHMIDSKIESTSSDVTSR